MAHRMPTIKKLRRFGFASFALALVACGSPPVVPQAPRSAKLAETFVEAMDHEINDPLTPTPYLDALDRALTNHSDRESLATAVAALDALVSGF